MTSNHIISYHGAMTAATLLPVGLPLCGLQVYENMRAVDYLLTRPEVDGTRLGITGASGGGNQTIFSGAWDERFVATVPVCAVANNQVNIGKACCLCLITPGILRFSEVGNIIGITAPRAVMVINGAQDSIQFSPTEAKKSITRAHSIYELLGNSSKLQHVTLDFPHDYNKQMREAMYGWMTKYLKGIGDGSPITEPQYKTEDPEALRCFPVGSRPEKFLTVSMFAAREARIIIAGSTPQPKDFFQQKTNRLFSLDHDVFGGFPLPAALKCSTERTTSTVSFESEPGIKLTIKCIDASANRLKVAILLNIDSAEKITAGSFAKILHNDGWSVAIPELRATGRFAFPNDAILDASDHNSAEWAMWIGRPLLGQWVYDVHRAIDALTTHYGRKPEEIVVIGRGSAGTIALCTAALDSRVTKVVTLNALASYITEVPYKGQRLGIMAPGILRQAGDIPQIAALIAPRLLVIAGGISGEGKSLDKTALSQNYTFTENVFAAVKAKKNFKCFPLAQEGKVAAALH